MIPSIPVEVRERVDEWAGERVPSFRIRFSSKEIPKCVAWSRCPMPRRDSRLRDHRQRNPWRKAHTENFWVWYSVKR